MDGSAPALDKGLEASFRESTRKDDDKTTVRTLQELMTELKEVDHDDIRCGVWGCNPRPLQVFANKQAYLALYSVVGVVLGSFFTYMVSVISTIEKTFQLNSKQTGFMLAGNDVSQILLSVLVSYFGNYGNRPKWMAVGVWASSISCFIATLPHVFYKGDLEHLEAGAPNTTVDAACPFSASEAAATEVQEAAILAQAVTAVLVLFASQFALGLAVSTFYSLGVVYLDDNLNKNETPIYYGLSMLVRVMGPVAGFLLGSQCLKLWIHPYETPNIDQTDPRWVGAWWLGFVILGCILGVLGFIMFMFPRQLPENLAGQVEKLERKALESKETSEHRDLQHYIKAAKQNKQHEKPSIKKLPSALLRLATNRIWLGNSSSAVCYLLALAGYWSFKPKFLEQQFHQTASKANLVTGMAGLVASVVGLMLGGIVIHWKKPRARYVTGYNCVMSLFGAVAFFMLIYVGCPQVDVNRIYGSELLGSCQNSCDCSGKYEPICNVATGRTYYSPCMADCRSTVKNGTQNIYKDCRCLISSDAVIDILTLEDGGSSSDTVAYHKLGDAVGGVCPQDCDSFVAYIALETIMKMVGATGRVGGTLVYLRSVEEQDKALAMGTLTVLMSIFAFIPGPLIMGAIVDSACKIWENEDGTGNCWLYDTDQLRYYMHVFPAMMILLSTIGDLVVFMNSKNLKLYADADESEEEIQLEKQNEKTTIVNQEKK